MGVNLEWEVCESGRGAGEEWAGATVPSSAELLLPAHRGFLCCWKGWEHLRGFGRRKGGLGEGIASRQFGLIRTHAQGMVVKRRFSMLREPKQTQRNSIKCLPAKIIISL